MEKRYTTTTIFCRAVAGWLAGLSSSSLLLGCLESFFIKFFNGGLTFQTVMRFIEFYTFTIFFDFSRCCPPLFSLPLPQQQQKKCNKSPHPRIDFFGRLSLLLIFGIFSTHNFLSLFIGQVFFTSFHFFFRFVLFARSRWILSVYFFLVVVYDRSVVQFRIVTRIDESLLSRRDGDKKQPAEWGVARWCCGVMMMEWRRQEEGNSGNLTMTFN